MMNSEDEEVVDSAILALKNLSTTPDVGVLIADCTGLEVLMRLLTSKTTSVITKHGASVITMKVLVAVGNDWKASVDRDACIDNFIETPARSSGSCRRKRQWPCREGDHGDHDKKKRFKYMYQCHDNNNLNKRAFGSSHTPSNKKSCTHTPSNKKSREVLNGPLVEKAMGSSRDKISGEDKGDEGTT